MIKAVWHIILCKIVNECETILEFSWIFFFKSISRRPDMHIDNRETLAVRQVNNHSKKKRVF